MTDIIGKVLMTDIIERLRSDGENERQHLREARVGLWSLLNEAADTIESLEEELDRYRNGYQGSCYACEPVGIKNKELSESVKEFFQYLDSTEESDSGVVFHPVHITCSRVLMMDPLNAVLIKMKDLSQ